MPHLGIKEIVKDVWGGSNAAGRSGVFPNFATATEPTQRPDGTALADGDLYYNTTDDTWYGRTNGSWTGISASGSAPSMQTAYNNGYTVTKATNAISITDADTDASNTLELSKTGAGSGNILDIDCSTTFSGNAVDITMTNASTAAQALVIASQAAIRVTNPLVDISELGTGAVPTLEVSGDAATTGPLFRLNASAAAAPVAGTDGMQTIVMTNVADASEGLFISNPTITRTGACLAISDAGQSTGQLIRLVQTDTSSANAIEYTCSGAVTGDAINILMTNAGATAQALVITGAAATTSNLVSISHPGTGGGNALAITASSTLSGDLLDLSVSGAVTGDFLAITMTNAGNGADGITMTGSPTGRTGDMLRIVDGATTGSGQSLEINSTGAKTGQHLLINVDAAAGGQGIHMDYDGAATGALFDIDLDATGSGIVFDIDIATSVWTGDIFNFNSTQAYAGDIFDITLTNCAAGVRAMVITGSATTRTAHLIEIAEAGTPSGDTINISHSGATTGDAIHCNQANAVAGRALNLDGSGTRTVPLVDVDTSGADTEYVTTIDIAGSATRGGIAITTAAVGEAATNAATGLHISATGVHAASSDTVRIAASGNMSSTSSVLAVEYATGTAPTQGVVYVNAKTAGDLAIKVDTGTVTIDETLLVTGGMTGAIRGTTGQTVAAGGTSTALTLAAFWHHIDADAGGDTFTLVDGADGQIKVITMESSTGTATITPDNLAGGTSVTFNAAADSVILMFVDTQWYVIGGNSYTIAA